MKTRKKPRPPIQPGHVVGGFRVISHYQDELFNCVCVAGGHEEIRSRGTLVSPTSGCKRCRRVKMYGEHIGKTFGTVTITGMTERPGARRGRENETITLYTYRCACGREGTVGVHSVINGDVSGRDCKGCRQQKLESAKLLNQDWNPTAEESKEINAAILRGVHSALTAKESEQIQDDAVSKAWIELLQYPERTALTTTQLAGIANRLGRRVAISTVQERNDYLREQAKPVKADDGEGEYLDVFDDLKIEKDEPTAGDELQRAALEITLTPEDIDWLIEYQSARGVKSKVQKKRYAELVESVRTAHADILAVIGEGKQEERSNDVNTIAT